MDKINKLPLIHIGLPRAASTTLQDHVFNQLDSVFYLGKIKGRKDTEINLRSNTIFKKVLFSDPANFEESIPELKKLVTGYKDRAIAENKRIVISKEGLCRPKEQTTVPDIANRLKLIFGDSEILIVLRDPRKWLLSCYNKSLMSRVKKNLIDEMRSLDIEKFFNESLAHSHYYGHPGIKPYDFYDAYAQTFGKDRVYVVLIEEFNTEKSLNLLSSLLNTTKNDLNAALALKDNASYWTTKEMETMILIKRFPLLSKFKRYLLWISRMGNQKNIKTKYVLSKEVEKKLMERAVPQLKKLKSEIEDLAIEEYGYLNPFH